MTTGTRGVVPESRSWTSKPVTSRAVISAGAIAAFVGDDHDADVYLCGPAPFMDLVETTLLEIGVDPVRIHHDSRWLDTVHRCRYRRRRCLPRRVRLSRRRWRRARARA